MHCRHCSNELSEQAVVCTKCGIEPRNGVAHCPECGVATKSGQVACLGCGVGLTSQSAKKSSGASSDTTSEIHCRSCSNVVGARAIVCVKCGMDPKAGEDHCPSCGGKTNPGQIACMSCGSGLKKTSSSSGFAGADAFKPGNRIFDDSSGIRNVQDFFEAVQSQVDGNYTPKKKDFMNYAVLPYRKFLQIEGRSSRKEVIASNLLQSAIALLALVFVWIPFINVLIFIALALLLIAVLPATICLYARRCHDLNITGWVSVLTVVPIVGILLILAFWIIPGTSGDNEYGPDPRAN